jgi:uncharacterized protein
VTAIIQKNIRAKYIFKAIFFCMAFTGTFVVFSFVKGFIPNKFERLSHGITGTLAAFFTTFLFLRFDRKQFSDIGLVLQHSTLIKFFTGILAGVIVMGLMVISIFYFSSTHVRLNQESNIWHFLLMTLPLIPLAFMEEIGFRAYPLQILKDKVGVRLAIIVTSVLFALYHIANGWTIASSFYGPGVWGLIFGLSAIYSRGIAMPAGIHYAVNLTTAAFGAANNTVSIWIVKQPQSTTAAIPASFVLLVFAIACIELYLKQKTATDKGAAAAGGE